MKLTLEEERNKMVGETMDMVNWRKKKREMGRKKRGEEKKRNKLLKAMSLYEQYNFTYFNTNIVQSNVNIISKYPIKNCFMGQLS